MAVVRILAEYAGDLNEAENNECIIVLDAVIDALRLKAQMCFGYYLQVEDGVNISWPFRLRKIENQHEDWVLDYGTNSGEALEPINIFERDIIIGGYFSVGEKGAQSTYRIIQINPL